MADPGFANGGPRSSAEGARIKAPKARRRVAKRRRREYRGEYRGAEGAEGVGLEERVSPFPMGRGHDPLPKKFFDFESENDDF